MRRSGPVGGLLVSLLVLAALGGCGNHVDGAQGGAEDPPPADSEGVGGAAAAKALHFRAGDEDVLLVWYDELGAPHTAEDVDQIPDAHRGQVRVDFLGDEGTRRSPPGSLYVADLTAVGVSEEFQAHSVSREAFDAQLRARAPLPDKPPPGAASAEASVILYGTSWCGACKQARGFLKQRGIPFQDRDIEKDPGARSELMQKAKQAGVRTQGVPVIDVNGTLMQGFSAGKLLSLLQP